jgi:hypothetical protein
MHTNLIICLLSVPDTIANIYGALESEPKKNGLDPSHAANFKQQYAAAKRARETSLLGLANQDYSESLKRAIYERDISS